MVSAKGTIHMQKLTLPLNTGVWISPTGETSVIKQAHIHDIIAEPRKFGLTDEIVKSTYEKYGERMGSEGQAREDLILQALKNGWIRVRNYRNYWGVTVQRLDFKNTRNIIKSWLEEFRLKYNVGQYEEFRIVEIGRDKRNIISVDEILKGGLFEQRGYIPSAYINDNKRFRENKKAQKAQLNENKKFYTSKGVNVYFTDHGYERAISRIEGMGVEEFGIFMDRTIDWLLANQNLIVNQEMFLSYSRSFQQGVVFSYRRQRGLNDVNRKHIIIITVLPQGKNTAKEGTQRFFVESAVYRRRFAKNPPFTFEVD
jgi:hypothetical protein